MSARGRKAPSRSKSSRTVAPQFKVGDIAEVVYVRTLGTGLTPGTEVEIVGGLETRDHVEGAPRGIERGYQVQIGCSDPYCVLPDQLRPISPKDPLQAGLWSECPWRPGRTARQTRRTIGAHT